MYIYDRKLSDARSLLEEQPFTSRTVGRNSDYPDQGVGGFLRRVRTNSTYMWANEGLGRGPTALPPKFRWGDKTFSTNIQSSFDKAIHAVRNDASFSHLPDVRTVPIAIMALDRAGGRPVAGQREFEMFYSGSLLKVVAMYAAYQLRVAVNDLAPTLNATVNTTDELFQTISNTFDKQIDESVPQIRLAPGITPAMRIPKYKTIFQAEKIGGVWRLKFNETGGANDFASHLRRMIVGSHNESAGFCIRALGYSWINGVLQAAGFLRFGFPGSEGLWLAGDYEQQKTVTIPSVNDGDVKQAATCFDMARLFALLRDKKLVRNTAHYATALSGNDEMLNLLKDAVDDPGAPSLLKRVPHSFVVRQSKIGVGELKRGGSCMNTNRDRCVYSEAAILQHPPTGRKFVVVWQNLTYLRAHPSWWSDGLKRIVALIQKTMDDYKP